MGGTFRAASELMGAALARAARQTNSPGFWQPVWAHVVGPALAGHSRVVAVEDGVWTVSCGSPAHAAALRTQERVILEKLQPQAKARALVVLE